MRFPRGCKAPDFNGENSIAHRHPESQVSRSSARHTTRDRSSANSKVLELEDALQTIPACGGEHLLTIGTGQNPDRNAKSLVLALQPVASGEPLPGGQPRPDPPPGLWTNADVLPHLPLRCHRDVKALSPQPACPPTHLRAPMFLLFLVPRRLELDLRRLHHPRPHSRPAHSSPEMIPPGLFFS